MKPSVLRRAGTLAALATLVASLAACSGDDAGADPGATTSATVTETTAPDGVPSETPTQTTSPTQTGTAASTPADTASGSPTDVPTVGGGAADLRGFLPVGFPIPDTLTITGDPAATEQNFNVTFTVPDAVEAFEFFKTELPEAGYQLLPGSSDSYSTDVSSGALLAQDEEFKVNLLIVDDEVEITITRRE